jgi:4-hydroxy-4-methyl-2-oxoglutarate aldolase
MTTAKDIDGNDSPRSSDLSLLASLEDLTVPLLADALDRLGYRHQVMSSRIRPVAAQRRAFGIAFTIQAIACATRPENPYETELEATDSIPTGAMIVLSAGGAMDAGVWGELLTTRALARGAIGAVIDGGVRDLEGIDQLGFPTFASTIHAADSYGRVEVVSYGKSLVCGDVPVNPGDIIGADLDGAIVVPREIALETISEASAKRKKERSAQQMLNDGASVEETYARHGVL